LAACGWRDPVHGADLDARSGEHFMKTVREFIVETLVSGALLALPVYLAIVLVLRALKSLSVLVRPLAALVSHVVPTAAAEYALALLAVVLICFALGVAVRTRLGRAIRDRIESSVLDKVPGYAVVRGLTNQLAGQEQETTWKPALVEMGSSLQCAFIIEEIDDSRYTVFIPGAPSPVRGTVHVVRRERVHPVNVSFPQAFQALTQWGAGVSGLVAALDASAREATRARSA
jgi:uncharacterized membrane protein